MASLFNPSFARRAAGRIILSKTRPTQTAVLQKQCISNENLFSKNFPRNKRYFSSTNNSFPNFRQQEYEKQKNHFEKTAPLLSKYMEPDMSFRTRVSANVNAVKTSMKMRNLAKYVPERVWITLFGEKVPKGFENFYPKGSSDSNTDKNENSEDGDPNKNKKEDDGKKNKNDDDPAQDPRVLATGAVLAFAIYTYLNQEPTPEITFQELVNDYLRNGYVEKLQVINKTSCRVFVRPDVSLPSHLSQARNLVIQLGSPESFEQKIEAHQVSLGIHPQEFIPIQYVNERDTADDMMRIFPTLFMMGGLFLLMRNMGGGMPGMGGGKGGGAGGRNIFSMGKAFTANKSDLKSKVKFKDVAGMKQAKAEVMEFVDFLKNPKKYEHLGAAIPKGGLLVGPPGTGKTLLAKAVAGESDRPFFSMSGSDFIEMFVGVGPSRVRDLFQQARDKAPSIIFIDEIDAVGRKRGKGGFSGGGNDERENTLNQLLVEMDGFSSSTNIVVLAGTNRADILDSALIRPGRFDRMINIDKPDISEREAIFMVHLKPIKTREGLTHKDLAKRMAALSPGYAGAEIRNICNEAAIMAARRGSSEVDLVDFERATERTMAGMAKTNNLMSPKEKRTIAVHESGHAIAGWFLEHSDPLLKVSIVPRSSGALGFAQYLPADMALHSKEALLDRMCVTLGGRAAEDLFLKTITSGASDDLKKVTQMSYTMISSLGMNERVGLFNYSSDSEYQAKQFSEETSRIIDEEARKLVDEQYSRTKALLWEKKEQIEALTDALFEKETLVYNDLHEILGDRPVPLNPEYEKFVTATSGYNEELEAKKDAENAEKKEEKKTDLKTPGDPDAKDGDSTHGAQPA